MKWFTTLALAICITSAASCNKGDDPVPSTKTNTAVTQEQNEWETKSVPIKEKKPTIKPKPEVTTNGSN